MDISIASRYIFKNIFSGDEDDIQFESDTSQSESEHNSVPTTPQPQQVVHSTVQAQTNYVHTDTKKNIQNIQISAMPQPTINTATPVVQVSHVLFVIYNLEILEWLLKIKFFLTP